MKTLFTIILSVFILQTSVNAANNDNVMYSKLYREYDGHRVLWRTEEFPLHKEIVLTKSVKDRSVFTCRAYLRRLSTSTPIGYFYCGWNVDDEPTLHEPIQRIRFLRGLEKDFFDSDGNKYIIQLSNEPMNISE